MLQEAKQIYENEASIIPDWRSIDRNELCRLYTQNEGDPTLKSAYFSAIILNYWGKLSFKKILRLDNGVYDVLVDSILKALHNRSWEKEGSSIYNDPKGPDKAINRIFKHTLINEYVKSNAQKYYADTSSVSMQELVEKTCGAISFDERDDTDDLCLSIDIEDFVKLNFKCKDYFMSFLIHIICYDDCIEKEIDGKKKFLSIKKVCARIHHMDDNWCEKFGELYGIDKDKVIKAAQYFVGVPTDVLTEKVKWYLRELRHYNIFTRG